MNKTSYVFALVVFASAYFIINSFVYIKFESTVLPAGDPFTYTVGFFDLINRSSESITAYFISLFTVLSPYGPNWYWVLNLFTVVLSPILPNESFALSIINIGLFTVASVFIFFFATNQKISKPVSFLSAMIIWIFPVNYGFSTYESLPVMGLDASFAAVYTIAFFSTLIFLSNPERMHLAICGGALVGVSIWGRGNSAATVALVMFVPAIWVLTQKRFWLEKTLTINILIYGFFALSFAAYFYYSVWQPLTSYYSHHATFFSRHDWNYIDASKWIWNIPGFLFWRDQFSPPTISITIMCHLLMVASLFWVFLPRHTAVTNIGMVKLLSVSGCFIYFAQLIINIIFFTDPLFSLENVLLIYRPMTLGMSLSFLSVLFLLHYQTRIMLSEVVVVPTILVLLVWAITFTLIQTPWDRGKHLATPSQVERFSVSIDDRVGVGAVSFLWYGHYNPRILQYYRSKNKLKPILFARFGHADEIWSASDHSAENQEKTINEIRKHIQNASLIIVPEFLDMYVGPHAYYKFSEEWAKIFSEPTSPKYRIVQYLDDYRGRLLVLKREDLAGNIGDPLPLPYGER